MVVILIPLAALFFTALNAVDRFRAMPTVSQNATAPHCDVPPTPPETEASISSESYWIVPLSSMLLLYNAAFWCLLWAICACFRGRCERIERQRSFFRQMTGDKIMRTKSIRHWITLTSFDHNADGERELPWAYGEKPTTVPRRAQSGRLDQGLLRLGTAFGTLTGFMVVLIGVFVSVAIAFSQIRRRRVTETSETVYGIAWTSLVDAVDGLPWQLLKFFAGRLVYDNFNYLVSIGGGVVVTWISTLCYCVRSNSTTKKRLAKLEEATKPATPTIAEMPLPHVQSEITAMGRVASDPAEFKEGARPSPVKRVRSVAALDSRVTLRRDASLGGRALSQSKIRDARLVDVANVPDLNGISWVGPSLARSASVLPLVPSAPPPPYEDSDGVPSAPRLSLDGDDSDEA